MRELCDAGRGKRQPNVTSDGRRSVLPSILPLSARTAVGDIEQLSC